MDFTRNQAKALANQKELELFDDARKPNLTKLTKSELKSLVKRSRTLRDRLRDVKRKQVRSKQAGKGSRGAAASDRSQEKVEMFSQVHDVFVERLAYIEDKELKQKEKEKAEKVKQSESKKKAGKKVTAKAPAPKKGSAKQEKTTTSSAKKTEAKKSSTESETNQIEVTGVAPDKRKKAVSAKATTASKATVDPMVDADRTLQAKARKGTARAQIVQKRIDKSGVPQQQSHVSSLNKRKQGKKDSR